MKKLLLGEIFMEYRRFGSIDSEVSVIGFGGAALSGEGKGYGFGSIDESDAIYLLHFALDSGINLFDTAPIYGHGLSEVRMGKAFKDRRDKVFIVSKCGVDWSPENPNQILTDNSPETTQRMLDKSLIDLQTDYLDLYLVHWPDPKVDIRSTMQVLSDSKKAGKIRAIGLSNSFPMDINKAIEIDRVDVLQNEFNMFKTRIKDFLFPIIEEKEMGFMSWGTLEKGILTGRVTPDRTYDKHDVRGSAPWWVNANHTPKFKAMELLKPLLEQNGYSGLELAIGYVLQYSQSTTALCGTRNVDQIKSTLKALKHLPPQELLLEAESIVESCLNN